MTSALFAHDTTIVGKALELEEEVRVVKEKMGRWEEKNHENKEKRLEFGTKG